MAEPGTRNRKSVRGTRTRTALLDAAEHAFGLGGYDGATLREIAGDAGVPLGVVHYHFQGKDQLFREAVLRKQPAIMKLVEDSFVQAETRSSAPLDIRQVLECFLRPFLSTFVQPGHAMRDYVRMTSHMMSSYRIPEVREVLRGLNRITEPLERRLKLLLPDMRDQDFYAVLYILEAAIIFMEQDTGFIDDLTLGHHSADRLDKLVTTTAVLFTGGIAALLQGHDKTYKLDPQNPDSVSGTCPGSTIGTFARYAPSAEAFWLSDEQWAAIHPLLPDKVRGVGRVDDRRVISGILHVLATGIAWSKAPECYGPRKTLYNRYKRWSKAGVWPALFATLADGSNRQSPI